MIIKFLKNTECNFTFGNNWTGYHDRPARFGDGDRIGIIKIINKQNGLVDLLLMDQGESTIDGHLEWYTNVPKENIEIVFDRK